MNTVDVLIVLVILASTAFGFLQGFLRQAVGLLSLYLAVVLAAQYHTVVGPWIAWFFTADPTPLASVAFVLVFAAALSFLGWLTRHVYPSMRLLSAGVFDNIGGAGVGILTGGIVVSVATTALIFATSVPWPGWDQTRLMFNDMVARSLLLPVVSEYTKVLFSMVSPWFPGGNIPALFSLYLG